MNIIIAGFPGVGKSFLTNDNIYYCKYGHDIHYDVIDLESSIFHWEYNAVTGEKRENPNWVKNYVEAIIAQFKSSENNRNKFILISTHEEVLQELANRKITFIIVAPKEQLKNEYMIRYLRRGNDAIFIKNMYSNWYSFQDSLLLTGMPIIRLEEGKYLGDILP